MGYINVAGNDISINELKAAVTPLKTLVLSKEVL